MTPRQLITNVMIVLYLAWAMVGVIRYHDTGDPVFMAIAVAALVGVSVERGRR